MKLIVAVVQDYDVDRLLRAVTAEGFRATRIASTGGYLRLGNATVILGVPDERVRRCLELLATTCRRRRVPPDAQASPELAEYYASGLADLTLGGGVAFVADVTRHERIAEAAGLPNRGR